jgi:hypothetical protein
MNMHTTTRTLPTLSAVRRSLALLTTVLVAGPVMAQSHLGEDPSLMARYRCGVLGDMAQCSYEPAKPSPRVEERVVLGPRAKYLIHLGVDPATAVAEARLAGEVPMHEQVRITTRALSSAEAFDRANGRFVAPEQQVEVLSARPVRAEAEAVASH